jgi:hypothetical protein
MNSIVTDHCTLRERRQRTRTSVQSYVAFKLQRKDLGICVGGGGGKSIPSNKADTGSWTRWQVAVCSNPLPTHIANIKTRFSKKHEQWNSEIPLSSSNRPVRVFLRGLLFTLNNTPSSNPNRFFLQLLIPDLYSISRDSQYIVAVFLFHSVENWGWTETSWWKETRKKTCQEIRGSKKGLFHPAQVIIFQNIKSCILRQ